MSTKSLPTTRSVQCGIPTRKLGCYTDPTIYLVEDCRSHGSKKTFKRKSEESPERAAKRSRTGPSPSEGCSQTFRVSSTSDTTASSALVYTGPPDSTVSATSPSSSTETGGRKSTKRKSAETEEPRKRSRKTSPSEGPSHQTTTEAFFSDKPSPSSSVNTGPPNSRAAFKAKYREEQLLGAGGFGSVYAGYRKDDNLPVAIKHICHSGVDHTSVLLDGKISRIPLEVALLLKVQPAIAGTSAVVSLLDWYDLGSEVILVLERPIPCMDLVDYLNARKCAMPEHKAKIITKQLVDALIEVHSRGVFHRDIKLENILIETGSDVPRVRLIDFGCGTFLSEERFLCQTGTYDYTTPEWFLRGWYTAEPTTVWQLGVVLFGMLHASLPFSDSYDIMFENPEVRDSLSFDCRSYLLSCLTKTPEDRPSLEMLKHHPWLM